ncbi:hypothetical protein AMST5_03009 [freshwater sediment metagenome]|uniref:Uncharacterized protein n=1 Tax=freshwater sediment metagenome TaxID=556182 RepID=A0AA48M326_9ZZZZ
MATNTLDASRPYDRAATMRNAHRLYRYAQEKGWTDWPFARCVRFAMAESRGRRELSRFADVERAMRAAVAEAAGRAR